MSNILDGDQYEMALISTVCSHCKHENIEDIHTHTCTAFPSGIPRDIWLGKNDHTTPYPGDNGIRFEAIK
jgi:hypothetical protein